MDDRLGSTECSRISTEKHNCTKCKHPKNINIYGRTRRRQSYLRYRIGAIAIAFSLSCILSIYSIKYAKNELEHAAVRSGRFGRSSDELTDTNITEPEKCINATFEEFPDDGLTHEQRKGGAIIIHILISIYMFLGLAIICDDYFVASLEQIVEKLKLSDDVAGATFMAAGSSAPELFTSLIGVFIAKSDVGTGTIVGSAVFNILVIIGLCALFCNAAIQLSWWPLVRDSSYYLLAIGTLIVVMYDEKVYWYEAMIMILLYIGYIIIMKFNSKLQGLAIKLRSSCGAGSKKNVKTEETNGTDVSVGMLPKETTVNYTAANGQTVATVDECAGIRFNHSGGPNNEMATVGMRMMISNNFAPKTRLRMASRLLIMEDAAGKTRKNILAAREHTTVNGETERMLLREPVSKMSDDGEEDEESYVNPFKPPKESFSDFMKWFISWPLLFLFFFTIPNCSTDRFAKWFLLTFLMSIVWITLFSYVMVWMICLTGYTLGIPDTVMGITFLAAGTSVPDTIASVLVARNGYGDMAVSNSIGSNVFDIFLGLGLPWLLKTTIRPMGAGPTVNINSKGLLASVGLLMLSLIIVVLSIHFNKWRLTKKLGYMIMTTYAIFLVFSILIETNTFMDINPPTCREL